jgi:Sec-independent protein secretion pathway component TatC
VGLVLLLGLPYAMIVQDLAFGIVCGLLLIIPVVLTAVWIPVAFFGLLREKRTPSTAPNSESALETVSAD